MESNSLALTTQQSAPPVRRAGHIEAVRPSTMQEIERVAAAFAHSGAFPGVQQMAQAYVRIMAGQEWGLGPMASMQGIYFIEGKPTLAAVTVAGCIKKSGVYSYKQNWVTRVDGKLQISKDSLNDNIVGCYLAFYENGEWIGDSAFTDEDAARAGLSHGNNWKKYPKNMYFSRAMTNGARWYCSDVFGGSVWTPDEIVDTIEVDGSGRPLNYVERLPELAAQSGLSAQQPPPPDEKAPAKVPTLKELRALYEMTAPSIPGPKVALGVWLETSGIAPELSNRTDELTGKQIGLTDAEKLAAFAKLTEISQGVPGVVVMTEAAYKEDSATTATRLESPEPETFDAGSLGAPAFDFPPDTTPVGINDAQRKRIMVMFNERSAALTRMFPVATSAEKRRHAFAETTLNDKTKGSSKTWTRGDYTAVSDALEALPKDEADD
jgi:hypothetical protein